jgi:hypothetical protein
MTGNVRGGRSFMGALPYNQQGSQLAITLPSLGLSQFSRDSVSLADVVGPMTYGASPQPYFAGAGSVTSLYTAETRFATPAPGLRPAYSLPNLNTALPVIPPTRAPGAYYVPPVTAPAATPTTATGGLAMPQMALDWVRALEDGSAAATPTAASGAPATTTTTGLPGEKPTPSMRIGQPYILPPVLTDNRIGVPKEKTGFSAAETAGRFMPFAGTPGVTGTGGEPSDEDVYWAVRNAAIKLQAEAAAKTAATATAPSKIPAILPPTELPSAIPPMPGKYVPAGTFADYIVKAGAAMKEANYAKAESLYAAAAAQDPQKPEAFYGRIYALLADRQYDLAYFVLDRDLKTHPDWIKQAPSVADVLTKPGTVDRLTTELKESSVRRPNAPDPSFLLGFVYYTIGNNDEAMLCLRRVAKTRGKEVGPEKEIMAAIEARTQPPAPSRAP